MREEILQRLQPIFAEVFEDDGITVTEQTTADDVEKWDSLTHLTLIYEVESEFGMMTSFIVCFLSRGRAACVLVQCFSACSERTVPHQGQQAAP